MKYLIVIFTFLFIGCGEVNTKQTPTENNNTAQTPSENNGGNSDSNNDTPKAENNTSSLPPSSSNQPSISGKIRYQYYEPIHSTNNQTTTLSQTHIATKPSKQIVVKAIDEEGNAVQSTTTDNNGNYRFSNLPKGKPLKIRVYAKMSKGDKWNLKVIDNMHSDSLYVVEGSLKALNGSERRDITTSVSNLGSAPFAILDDVYQAMQKVLSANSNSRFPKLDIKWSTQNISSTTYYSSEGFIRVLGDQQGDSDEYDNHVIIHEWGHYFEENFSRADSIGGNHGDGEKLDIRLAFGEGFGNAFSAIVTDDPYYYDTARSSNGERGGWYMNIESSKHNIPGYYSESSIQRILYDLYDSHDDNQDTISLGFKPLYTIFTGAQKTTPAFTSIFSFITELKNVNSRYAEEIDSITRSENISDIADIYGTQNNEALYKVLRVGEAVTISTNTYNGIQNKLNNHRYIQIHLPNSGNYRITVNSISSNNPDPDFILYQTEPFEKIALSEEYGTKESTTYSLSAGDYLLDVYDAFSRSTASFSVTIN